jgi:hypothetical protein
MPLTDDTKDGISDEILKQAEEYIKELLKNKRLKAEVRAQLEIQSYFLMFLASDHERISKMYPFYKQQSERQKRLDEWWSRLQWVLIPIAFAYLIEFVINAVGVMASIYQRFSP